MSAVLKAFPAARRGTHTFLRDSRNTADTHLTTDIDATRLKEARRASGGKLSYVSLVVKAAADVIAASPEARTVLLDGLRPRIAVVDEVHAKVLFDKTIGTTRCVLSGIVTSAQARSAIEIQDVVNTYKDADVDDPAGPFAQTRRMQRLPLPLARLVYRLAMREPERRTALQGVFSVTSVGREPVRTVFPVITGTLGFGVGRIADTPVAVDGRVEIAPVMCLSLTFDHRVVDGALASELLARTKTALETWETP
jgi:pyruvate/2-oxoglutarate dehydrogenase complex dihydrolipoamide acyltransferase (E2) component